MKYSLKARCYEVFLKDKTNYPNRFGVIEMKKRTVRLILLALAINMGFSVAIFFSNPSVPITEQEVKTVVETRYMVETEFVKVNQTEPMEMVTTAYTAGYESTGKRPGDKWYGITFTGTQAKVGVCAVDPNFIPLGESLYVEDYGYCRAEDIGGLVKGYHVDVFMDELTDALKFGRQNRKVWILNNFEGERQSETR